MHLFESFMVTKGFELYNIPQVDFKSNKFLKKVTWQEQTKVVKQR